jgi:hypothetical protein
MGAGEAGETIANRQDLLDDSFLRLVSAPICESGIPPEGEIPLILGLEWSGRCDLSGDQDSVAILSIEPATRSTAVSQTRGL